MAPLVVSRTVCTQTTPPLSIVQYDLIMKKGRVYAYIEVGVRVVRRTGDPEWHYTYALVLSENLNGNSRSKLFYSVRITW